MVKKFDPLSLEEYMQSKPIKVKKKNLTYPTNIIPKYQFRLFDNKVARQIRGENYNRAVGVFYEIITEGITGGTWMGLRNSATERDSVYKPDVVSEDKLYDAKSVAWNRSCKLTDFQMDKALLQECTGAFIQPQKRIFIPLFKYKLSRPWKEFDSAGLDLEKILVSTLCEQTGFCLFLPFQVIYNIYSKDIPASDYKSRYEGDKWDHTTRFLCGGIKKMLLDPETALSSIQLNPEHFEIKKTHLPKGVKVNNNNVNPFPILFMDYKNGSYEDWLDKISIEKKEDLERLKYEKRTREDYRTGKEGPHFFELRESEDPFTINLGFDDEKMKREMGEDYNKEILNTNSQDEIPF
jgi:hypothetical protein